MNKDDMILVSVDDHVVEPAHLWQTWLPEKFKDKGPKVERRGIGHMRHIGGGAYEQTFDPAGPLADCWVYEDLVYINKRHVAAVGFDRDDMTMSPITYDEMRPGCYDVHERVRDMNAGGQLAGLNFPNWTGFSGQVLNQGPDRDLNLVMIKAYNDWHVDEWCGAYPDRFIPMAMVPLCLGPK